MAPTSSGPGRQVTVMPGDGIGPEVVTAACRVLEASGVALRWDVAAIGHEPLAREGTPLPATSVASLRRTGTALKGPVTTPMTGHRSVNVSLREELGLFVQVRLSRSLPGLPTPYHGVDLAIVREITEDLYAGVEFASGSPEAEAVRECINNNGFALRAGSGLSVKAVSVQACRRASEFAFGWARAQGRRRVTIVHKATNIRCTDGLFRRIALEVAEAFPDLEVDDCLVDNAAARLVRRPQEFDVLFTQSVFGDILSDLAAGLVGGVGVAPGATFGDRTSIFEPVHGSAPKHAGRDRVNPLATTLSGVMLLRHLGEADAADRIEAAVVEVLGAGVRTYDVAGPGDPVCSSSAFTDALVDAIGPPDAAAEPAAPRGAGASP